MVSVCILIEGNLIRKQRMYYNSSPNSRNVQMTWRCDRSAGISAIVCARLAEYSNSRYTNIFHRLFYNLTDSIRSLTDLSLTRPTHCFEIKTINNSKYSRPNSAENLKIKQDGIQKYFYTL